MIIQQVHMSKCDLYITGVSPRTEWEGTIVFRLYENGKVIKCVEPYFKHPDKENCISTKRFFIPIMYLFNFIALNTEVNENGEFKLKEVLIDSLDLPTEPLGGNFG